MNAAEPPLPCCEPPAATIKRVTRPAEIAGIHALQSANLGRHLPPAERAREGFLTSEYTLEFLSGLHRHAPAVIAVADDAVVGYALVATTAVRELEPSLASLYASIDAAVLDGTRIAARTYIVCAAVCVAKSHRGLGLVSRLYGRLRVDFAPRHDCVITDIARDNARSLAAHRRAGFRVCSSACYGGQTWDLVCCDWARPISAGSTAL